MRILWLSHLVPYPPKAGVLLRSYHLVRELGLLNDVDVIAFTQQGLLRPIFEDIAVGLEEARQALHEYCGRVEFVDLPSDTTTWGRERIAASALIRRRAYNELWARSQEFRMALRRFLSDSSYDVVHFDTIGLMQYVDELPPSVCTVLDHHNVESHMLLRRAKNEQSVFKRAYFTLEAHRVRELERKWCPTVDLNVMCSDTDGERLREVAPDAAIATVPNGVDVDFFSGTAGGQRANRIIFVGTLDWYPNTEAVRIIAHEIWPLLRDRDATVQCDIIGANPPTDVVAVGAQDPRFHVHGFVDDIRPHLEDAACYVCPIRDGGGTKLKILDALAMAKAVVADPVACEGIDVSPGESVLFANTAEEYVEAIVTIINDPELRGALEAAGRRKAEHQYSFKAIVAEFQENLEELVRQPSVQEAGGVGNG